MAEPDTSLEHLQQNQKPVQNTAWTLITFILIIAQDIQFLRIPCPSPPPVTIHFRLNFDHFLPDPSLPPLHLLDVINVWPLRGCSYGGELARLAGLARLGEMIYIPRSYGIFYHSSIKKFAMSLKKIDQVIFTTLSRLGGLAHLRVFIWKIFISPRWDLDKINTISISI